MKDMTTPVLICGEGPVAARTYALLQARKIPVRAVARYEAAMNARVLVECNIGVTPALDNVMKALGQGVSVATTNALLMAVHGRVLHNAARGQQAGLLYGAALGMVQPMAAWLTQAAVQSMTLVSPHGANAVMQRMLQRDEEAHKAQLGLELQGADTTDAAGKHSYAHAMAVHGWMSGYDTAPDTQREGPETLTKTLLAQMRRFGLSPLHASHIQEGSVRAGLMAAMPDSAVMQGLKQETCVVETPAGEQVFSRAVVTDEATAQALVTDVQTLMNSPHYTARQAVWGQAEARQYLLVGEYVHRHRLLETGATLIDEQLTNSGDWLAIEEARAAPVSSIGRFFRWRGGTKPRLPACAWWGEMSLFHRHTFR